MTPSNRGSVGLCPALLHTSRLPPTAQADLRASSAAAMPELLAAKLAPRRRAPGLANAERGLLQALVTKRSCGRPLARLVRMLRVLPHVWLLLAALLKPARAEPEPQSKTFTKDIRHSALTAPAGTLELGVFSYGKYALNERVELSLHPLGFFLWPELDAKLRWLDSGSFTFSTHHALSCPAWFLGAVAREGTGGLVDPNASIPATFQIDVGLLATWRLGPKSWATIQPLAQFGVGKSTPLLEFPFLYQRLVAVNAGWMLGVNAGLEGIIADAVAYEISATYSHLPLPSVQSAFAVEAVVEARLLLSRASSVPLGVRFAHARFPYGRSSHWFPYVDYRVVW